jgi:uncharacterized SAM-binding protein YcdF (DUF218 family)
MEGRDKGVDSILISKRKNLLKRLFLTIALIAVIVLGTIYINILYYGHTSKPAKSDVIIVLGCRIEGTSPSLSLKYRLDKAWELYNSGYARYIIVSGGKGANEVVSESAVMKSWLNSRGVKRDIIIEENKSSNTYENLVLSKELMKKNNFRSAIIVSNDFHIFRSLRIAKKLDIKASAAPALTVWYLKLYYQAREILSVIKGFLLDRI